MRAPRSAADLDRFHRAVACRRPRVCLCRALQIESAVQDPFEFPQFTNSNTVTVRKQCFTPPDRFVRAAIFVHEFGHYSVARGRGLNVEAFAIGFSPKLFSWTRNGIEYSIRCIPAGSFVKLPQTITSEAVEGAHEEKEKLEPVSCRGAVAPNNVFGNYCCYLYQMGHVLPVCR
jgi:hypothetical protein